MEIKTTVEITKIKVQGKIEEIKEDGDVVDKRLVTTITIEANCAPGEFDDVMLALANAHPVEAWDWRGSVREALDFAMDAEGN